MTRAEADIDARRFLPTVFIGLGGTGVGAIRFLMTYAAAGRNGRVADPDLKVALDRRILTTVGIDTDESEFDRVALNREVLLRRRLRQYDHGTLPHELADPHHALSIDRSMLRETIELARRSVDTAKFGGDARAAKQVRGFLAPPEELYSTVLPRSDDAPVGAGQYRALGRLAFLSNLPQIQAMLTQAIGDIGAQTGTKGQPRIAILSSLAGGTGAGMFLDTAILVRKFLAPDARISLHVLLPELFVGMKGTPRVRPNAFAALKELATLARPNLEAAMTIDYSHAGYDQVATIRPDDPTLINEVNLYGLNCARIDWPVDAGRRGDLVTRCAQRAMADSAVALSLRRVQLRNKKEQNDQASPAGDARYSTSVFGSAGVAQFSLSGDEELQGILGGALAQRMFWGPLDSAEIEPREAHAELPPLEDQEPEDQKRQRLQDALFGSVPDAATSSAGGAGQRSRPSLPEAEKLIKELKRAYDREKASEVFKAHELSGFAGLLAKPLLDGAETFQFDMRALLKMAGASDAARSAARTAVDRARALKDMADAGCTMPEGSLRMLKKLVDGQQVTSQGQYYVRALSAVELTIPDSVFRNRSLIIDVATPEGATRTEAVDEARKLLERYDLGPLKDELARIRSDLIEVVFNATPLADLASAKTGEDGNFTSRHTVVSAALLDKYDDCGALLNTALQKFRDNHDDVVESQRAVLDAFSRRTEGAEDTRRTSQRFAMLLDGFESWAAALAESGGQRGDGAADNEMRERRKRRGELSKDLWDALALAGFKELERNELERRFSDFLDVFVTARAERALKADPGEPAQLEVALAEALEATLLSGVRIKDEDGGISGPAAVVDALEKVKRFETGFIAFLLSQPEFRRASLGSPEQIETSVMRARSALFRRGFAVGGAAYDMATLHLPPVEQEGGFDVGFDFKRVLENALSCQVEVDYEDGARPMLLHVSRGYMAEHIQGLEHLRASYLAHEETNRVLFHVLPGAERFADPGASGPAQADGDLWYCSAHEDDEPHPNAVEEPLCTKCLREYEGGARRLGDISANVASGQVHPVPDVLGGVEFNLFLLDAEIEVFRNGVSEPDWKRKAAELEAMRLRLGEEPLHGKWKPNKPPRLMIPQAPSADGKSLELVFRKGGDEGRFVQVSSGEKLMECHHCGFPALPELEDGSALEKITCPRCRRELGRCGGCADSAHVYTQMISLGSGIGGSTCSRCGTEHKP